MTKKNKIILGAAVATVVSFGVYIGIKSTLATHPVNVVEKPNYNILSQKEQRRVYVSRLLDEIGDESIAADKRLFLVDELPDDLTAAEVDNIVKFIRESPNGNYELAIKNNLFNELLAQQEVDKHLAEKMIAISSDAAQNITVRIYATQHLRTLYEITHDTGIRNYYYALLEQSDDELAGTALLALNYLSSSYPEEFERSIVMEKALTMAKNSATNPLNRISAMQVAVAQPDNELIVVLRNIVAEEGDNVVIFSAIAALGELGDKSDLEQLQKIASGKKVERVAASSAIKKIKQRERL